MRRLPGRLPNARDHTFVSKLAEADTAKTEITDESVTTAAFEASVLCPGAKLRLSFRSYDD